MTKSDIIKKFELFMDDTTELSTQEESDLFDKIYQEICAERPWEFLKASFAGTQSASVPYIALPSNFGYIAENRDRTGNNTFGERPVVFVGSGYSPYEVVNFSDRRQYRNDGTKAYVDLVASQLVFTLQPTAANAVEYDYISVPTALAPGDTPIFPPRFHDAIYHGMCADEFIIEQSDKAKSYRAENQNRYADYIASMALWNANNIQL